MGIVWIGVLLAGLAEPPLLAQTDGAARLEVTLLDYKGTTGTKHWTVAWVTTASGVFIKTLWKQGPSLTASHWNNHCGTWYTAKAGSTALDGYTSATAANYAGTNSPVVLAWNGRDADNNLVPDGAYKFWVQYAEDSGQGPYTTGGLAWTKGSTGTTNNYPNQGANFASMRLTWMPASQPSVPPTITSAAPTATDFVGSPYTFGCSATGTAPITFSASGLPTGLAISPEGVISGTPTAAGSYTGTISAGNGTPPAAVQPFSILVGMVPLQIAAVRLEGSSLLISGSGPANGPFQVQSATSLSPTSPDWAVVATQSFNSLGGFTVTNVLDPAAPGRFYRLRLP